jgi:hypothetical protein
VLSDHRQHDETPGKRCANDCVVKPVSGLVRSPLLAQQAVCRLLDGAKAERRACASSTFTWLHVRVPWSFGRDLWLTLVTTRRASLRWCRERHDTSVPRLRVRQRMLSPRARSQALAVPERLDSLPRRTPARSALGDHALSAESRPATPCTLWPRSPPGNRAVAGWCAGGARAWSCRRRAGRASAGCPKTHATDVLESLGAGTACPHPALPVGSMLRHADDGTPPPGAGGAASDEGGNGCRPADPAQMLVRHGLIGSRDFILPDRRRRRRSSVCPYCPG